MTVLREEDLRSATKVRKGGPEMPEMLTPTSAIMGQGLGKDVALTADGRFPGGSHGFIAGHVTPEAQEEPYCTVRDNMTGPASIRQGTSLMWRCRMMAIPEQTVPRHSGEIHSPCEKCSE